MFDLFRYRGANSSYQACDVGIGRTAGVLSRADSDDRPAINDVGDLRRTSCISSLRKFCQAYWHIRARHQQAIELEGRVFLTRLGRCQQLITAARIGLE